MRRIGKTEPGDDSQAAHEGDRIGDARDRDPLDRRQDARGPSRRRRSFRPRRSALHRVIEQDAEASRFVPPSPIFVRLALIQPRQRQADP
jgi:hypothetical protein